MKVAQLRFLLARIHDLLGPAEDDDRTVVDRVVEGRAREHQGVDVRHRHADRGLAGRVEHAAHRGAVQVEVIALAPVERRDHDRRAVAQEADVADEAAVEDRVDRRAVIVAALAQPLDARARRGRAGLARCGQLPPQLFEKPRPQVRGQLIVIVPGGALSWS